MNRQPMVDYAIELAGAKPKEVRFVVMDGSTAEGSDRRYSDYDVLVVKKGLLTPPGSVKDLFGVFNGRIVSGWLVDEVSFKHRYIGDDDEEFLWRRRQLRKATLLYGDAGEFDGIVRTAIARRWSRKRQMAVVRGSYVTMVEYMGKMLNKVQTREDGAPEFYQDGYIVAENAMMLVAALNKIDLDSDKNMYRRTLTLAKIIPPSFESDFKTASGLAGASRKKEAVVAASRRLLRWARKTIMTSFEPEEGDGTGFWSLVREIRF